MNFQNRSVTDDSGIYVIGTKLTKITITGAKKNSENSKLVANME